MRNSVRIARISGIDIGVDASWIVIFLFVAWTLAVGLFPQQYPGMGGTTYWLMGIASSLLLFVSVIVHELAHSLVARAKGIPVRNITLFIFGGVSNIERDATKPGDELQVAIVGPISSLVLAAIFWVADQTVPRSSPTLDGVLSYLAGINLMLAIFNLIPGFPLDGGRVLRSILWAATNSILKATRIAGTIGQVVGYLMLLGGIFAAFTGSFIGGLWTAFIGWFLIGAAQSTEKQTELEARLKGIQVAQVMNPRPLTVNSSERLSDLVNDHILDRGIRALPVVDSEGQLAGLITLSQIRAVPRDRWSDTPVGLAMIKTPDLRVTHPGDSLASALRTMGEGDINQLPVMEGGRLLGLLSRGDVLRFLQVREELGVGEPPLDGEKRRAA